MNRRVSSRAFIGRRDQLAALVDEFDGLDQGSERARFVLVEGEAGIGKTRLVREFAAEAERRGACVLWGECLPLRETVPYAPLLGWRRDLPGLDDAVLDGASGRSRFFRAIADGLASLAGTGPVVVVVDDLHWADESTLDLVLFLGRSRLDHPMLMVGTLRPGEPSTSERLTEVVGDLARAGSGGRIAVPRFGTTEVREQLHAILGVPPGRGRVDEVLRRCDGNPFFIEELVASGPGDDLPPSVRALVLVRAGRLSAESQRLLQLAATVGRRVSHRLLELVAGPTAADALREAVAAGLLVPDPPDGYVFRHALTREAVYRQLLPHDQAAWHERIAVALERDPSLSVSDAAAAVAAELARHWHRAGRAEDCLRTSMRAARAADTAYAPAEAHMHYERVLELWNGVPEAATLADASHREVLEAAAAAASVAGLGERSTELVSQALDTSDFDRAARARLLERLGRYAWLDGDMATSRRAYEQAGREVPDEPSTTRARVLAATAQQLMLRDDLLAAGRAAADAVEVARAVGARREEIHATCTLGVCRMLVGWYDDGDRLLRNALAGAHRVGEPDDLARGYINITETLIVTRRPAAAVPIAREGRAAMYRHGSAHYAASIGGNLLWALVASGRWDEATTLERELAESHRPGWSEPPYRIPAALLAGRRGDRAAAAEHLGVLDDLVGATGDVQYGGKACAVSAEEACWRDDWTAARQAVARGLALTKPSDDPAIALHLATLGVRVEADAVDIARLRGEPVTPDLAAADTLVRTATERLERVAAGGGNRAATADLEKLLLAERSRLDPTPDPGLWAVVAGDAGGDRFLLGYARWREADALLAGHGQNQDAANVLRQAWAIATELGAVPLADRVADLGRRARIDLDPGQTSPTPAEPAATAQSTTPDPLAELTPREHEVLRLVGAGLSNGEIAAALFISTKTASVHVSNILRKLGLTSRVQAAAVAHRRGLVNIDEQPPR